MAEIEYDGELLRYKPLKPEKQAAITAFEKSELENKGVSNEPNYVESVANAYISVFGYVAPPFPLFGLNLADRIPLRNIKSLFRAKGNFGQIRMPLEVQIPGGKVWQMLPNEPLLTIKGRKEIVKTTISRGRDKRGYAKKGSVKEVIYMDDYDITIDGIIIGENEDELPEDDIMKVHGICEYGLSLYVRHQMLNLLGINMLVIADFEFPTEAGEGENVQKYKLIAMSDEDFEEELLNG